MSVENLKKFALKLGQTQNFITNETVAILNQKEVADDIEDFNTLQMIKEGVGADNVPFGNYAPASVDIRHYAELQAEYIDLHFTGDFHESVTAEAFKSGKEPVVELGSTDPKWEGILKPQKRFEAALGLTEENAIKVGGLIAPLLAQRISNFWKI